MGTLIGCALALLGTVHAQEAEDADEDPTRPGLVVLRLDDSTAPETVATVFIADDRAPRKWTGLLRVYDAGDHQFRAQLAGHVEIRVAGKVVLSETADRERLVEGPQVALAADDLSLEIEWRPPPSGVAPRLWIGWTGPTFDWEPIPPQLLSHPTSEHPSSDIERGREWFRARRCDVCHAVEGNKVAPLAVAGLNRGAERWRPTWLKAFLKGEGVSSRHPQLAFDKQEVDQVAAALWNRAPLPKSTAGTVDAKLIADGEKLVHTTGCLACHAVGELGATDPLAGGDLSRIASKRSREFLARWLTDPAAIDPRHRMPVFSLAPNEREAIVAYLSTLGQADDASRDADADLVEHWSSIDLAPGRILLRERGCEACHTEGRMLGKPRLDAATDLAQGCLGERDPKQPSRPSFVATAEDRERLSAFLGARRPHGPDVRLAELGCFRCHSRQSSLVGDRPAEGLARTALAVYARRPEWAPHPASLTPPSLTGVGDKLTDEAMAAAVAGKSNPMRPHMAVRMPRFPLADADQATIVRALVAVDRSPEWSTKLPSQHPTKPLDKPGMEAAGRLVSADGFNCQACHAIGKTPAPQAPASAVGPNLSELALRVRRPWFDRWVRDPARIVPRMEMPAVKRPIAGVFDNDLNVQLDAVWQALNQPNFTPPEPNPVRVARRDEDGARAWTISDLLYLNIDGKRTLVQRPLLIVLPNGHNVLLDTATGDLVAWTVGDAARQRSRGKVWHWELAGLPLAVFAPQSRPIEDRSTVDGNSIRWRLSSWRLENAGVVIDWVEDRADSPARATLSQRIAVWTNNEGESGFTRHVLLQRGALTGAASRLAFVASGQGEQVSADPPARIESNTSKQSPTTLEATWTYATQAPIAPVPQTPAPGIASREAMSLAPGWTAERAPLSTAPMPTGLAWWSERSLLLTSLRGEIVEAFDADADGLPDETRVVADGLPAPYGLNVAQDNDGHRWVDVAVKGAVLRLETQRDNDSTRCGIASGFHILADGWGYSPDYHDWTTGLPRDGQGDYLIGLPCQQDDRSAEQAQWRGTVARIQRPTGGDRGLGALPWRVEPLTRGHRFPMGIAIDRAGHALVTDNQGNYTPFNELNHIVAGRHFGFINKRDLGQPTGEITPPAIAIPHPWTRSVNGLTTLDVPGDSDGSRSRAAFGAFTGHFVGCEYTTRRLVRMTVEETGGVLQGAVFPLTREPGANEGPIGPLVASVSPRGDLVVGSISEGGWGAAINAGELMRMRFDPTTAPAGLAAIEATTEGFRIRLTRPVQQDWLADPTSLRIESFRREATPAYGGEDQARRVETIASVERSSQGDALLVTLGATPRSGFVYEFRVQTPPGVEFFPAEGWYTRHAAP